MSTPTGVLIYIKTTIFLIFRHEFVHFCEKWNAEEYLQFRQFVFRHMDEKMAKDYAEGKSEHRNMEELIRARMEHEGRDYDYCAREVLADALAKILPDSNFAQELARENMTWVEQIVDMLKQFIADIKAALKGIDPVENAPHVDIRENINGSLQYLEEIRQMYDKLAAGAVENYQAAMEAETQKNTTQEGSVSHSIKRTRGMTLKEQLSAYYSKDFMRSDSFYFGNTPSNLTRSGLESHPLAMLQDDFKKSTRTKHNIPRRVLKNLHNAISHPIFSFTAGKQVAIMTTEIDGDGKPVVVAIHGGHNMDRMPVNVIKSIYGVDSVAEWVGQQIDGGSKFRIYDIEKTTAMLQTEGYLAEVGAESDGSWDTITQKNVGVKEKNARVSGKAKIDAVYLDAVNRGDMEAAQQMVDQAAREAGYDSPLLFHGTTANFNIFKKGDVGFHFGTKGAARGRAGYGKNVNIKAVYLNITNPIVFDEDLGSWDADYRLTKELYDRGILSYEEAMSVLRTDDGKYKRSTDAANKKLASVLMAKKYDGIVYKNTFETKKATTSYIVFSSEQAKSADPVTYDKDGNVIPLSKRFDSGTADIRYKRRTNTGAQKNSVDNSAEDEENGVTQKTVRSGQHDNGRVREGAAAGSEVSRLHREADTADGSESHQGQERRDRPDQVLEKARKFVEKHINNSPNAEEVYYYLLDLLGIDDSEITLELYDKAVAQLTEKLYNDAVNLHPVLFEDKWKIMGGSISALRRSLLDSANEKAETETKVSTKKRGTTLSDREVLEVAALRMDTSTLTEGEKTALQIFKDRLAEMRKLQIERERLGSLWHEQQFGSGDRSEAPKTLNRMQVLDGQIERAVNSVLSVEDKQILRDVLQKARQYVKEQSVDHYRGILERRKDRSTQAQLRQKLHSTVHELSQLLLHGDKNHHVPESMKKAVAGALPYGLRRARS